MEPHQVRSRWANRSGEFSPRYYAYYGPDETSHRLRARFDGLLAHDAAILELGCSAGRHLSHLHEHGYTDLHGVDINEAAFDVMAQNYPDLASDGTFYAAAIEDSIPEFDAGRFDAVFAVETLQHLHPDSDWVLDELARVTANLLVTVENEDGGDADVGDAIGVGATYVDDGFPLYHRDWCRLFTDRGFAEVESAPAGHDTLRVFRRSA